jgi:hypothetical protein
MKNTLPLILQWNLMNRKVYFETISVTSGANKDLKIPTLSLTVHDAEEET